MDNRATRHIIAAVWRFSAANASPGYCNDVPLVKTRASPYYWVMRQAAFVFIDRTDAQAVVEFVTHKLSGYDLHLLDWVRLYPMTAAQHQSQLSGECQPVTLSTCWKPRDTVTVSEPPLPQHKYRIKVNVWQGNDYPAEESNWGRIPPRPIRRRSIPDRYTTRGLCRWRYPDRLVATVHALARPLFLYLAGTDQLAHNPSDSNASAWGHRWAVDWLRQQHREADAEEMIAQLMQWTLIQSQGLPG